MEVRWGEEYRGPGQYDPRKTRSEREKELRMFLNTTHGRDVVNYYFAKYTGMLEGRFPPAGTLVIDTILKHEFPNAVVT